VGELEKVTINIADRTLTEAEFRNCRESRVKATLDEGSPRIIVNPSANAMRLRPSGSGLLTTA